MRAIKTFARDWLPPVIIRWLRCARHNQSNTLSFEGDFATWAEANGYCSGYDADEIFQRVRDSALKVKRGEAVFERDSVCFYHEEYRWEVLACLALGAAQCDGRLSVLDFGGALGSFYSQHKKFLQELKEIHWGVVEQKHLVECGRNEFEDGSLRFYLTIDECVKNVPVNVIFLSSVLQYLENPYDVLTKLGEQNANYIIVDRTPFIGAELDKIVIHRVPGKIFPATLPMRIFSETVFESEMNQIGYTRLTNFPCAEGMIGEIKFNGFLYKRNKS